MIRWLVSLWRGPLCDAGTGLGARPGCLKTAVHTTLVHPAGWSRGFRWCEEHKEAAGRATGIGQLAREGAIRKGGQNLTYQLKERPPDPPAQRPAAPLTDAQVLDADAELAALVRRAEVAEADAARLRAESEERRRGIEVTEDALHAAQAERDRHAQAATALFDAGRAMHEKLAAAEDLAALWDRQIEEYPATSEGRFAAAAVKLCGEELRVRLRPPKSHPHPGLVDLGLESDEEPTA